jgi:hypothetical protein
VTKKERREGRINLLKLIPIRNIDWKKDEQGLIVLLKPKIKNPFLARHVLPRLKSPHYRISLDEVGSFIWERCDGIQTVKEIADSLRKRFGDKVEPLYERLSLFLQSLERNRFILYRGK